MTPATAGLEDILAAGGVAVRWTGPGDEPVTTVTLNRPQVRNAQTPATWRALAAVGEQLPPATRVVVLRAEGPVFCAGIDLRMLVPSPGPGHQRPAKPVPGEPAPSTEPDLAAIAALDDSAADAAIATFQRAYTWWSEGDAVTVAVVQGAAVGAGFQLALACDLIVCGSDARFAMKETTLGLVPDLAGTGRLVRDVGYRRALDICLSGRWVDAAEALALGLAVRVVPTEELDEAATALVAALLHAPAAAVSATRRLLVGATRSAPDEQRAAERAAQLPLLRELAGGASPARHRVPGVVEIDHDRGTTA